MAGAGGRPPRGGGGGRRRGGGRPPGGGRSHGGGAGGGTGGGRPGRGGRSSGGGARPHRTPLEIAVGSTRTHLRRHAEGLRDDQIRLACRGLLVALHGNLGEVANPGELLGVVEQVQHVLHQGRREEAQLPVALRAVVAFALEQPRREREVRELVRLLLRHLYALAADHVPRQPRDDGRFRASALLDLLEQVADEYLDEQRFRELRG